MAVSPDDPDMTLPVLKSGISPLQQLQFDFPVLKVPPPKEHIDRYRCRGGNRQPGAGTIRGQRAGAPVARPICEISTDMPGSAGRRDRQHQQPGTQPGAQGRRPRLPGDSAAALATVLDNQLLVRALCHHTQFRWSRVEASSVACKSRCPTTPRLLVQITANKPRSVVVLATIRHTGTPRTP